MKILKIYRCIDCPHFINFMDTKRLFGCSRILKKINYKPFEIPKWCPLKDYKEGDNNK